MGEYYQNKTVKELQAIPCEGVEPWLIKLHNGDKIKIDSIAGKKIIEAWQKGISPIIIGRDVVNASAISNIGLDKEAWSKHMQIFNHSQGTKEWDDAYEAKAKKGIEPYTYPQLPNNKLLHD